MSPLSSQSRAVDDRTRENSVRFRDHAGDNIYGWAAQTSSRDSRPYQQRLRGRKVYAALGNHDAPSAADHISTRSSIWAGSTLLFVCEGDGLIEFFVLDTNETKTSTLMPEQLSWLEVALKLQRHAGKWPTFIIQFILQAGCTPLTPGCETDRPLFCKYRINVVFSGIIRL